MQTSKATRHPLSFPFDIRASKTIPASLQLAGELDFQAAEGSDDKAPHTFNLIANTGKPMDLAGFMDPVIIDIAGAKFDKKTTPVIADHDTTKRIGHTTDQAIIPAGGSGTVGGKRVNGPSIAAAGVVSSGMGIAQGFVADAKAGFPFQVSVGAKILEGYFVAEGEKAEVNGKTYKGPLIVAAKSLIRELSVTVLGADNDTSAKLAASANPHISIPIKDQRMNFEAYLKATCEALGLDQAKITDAQRNAIKAQWEGLQAANPPANPPANPAPGTDPEQAHLDRIAATHARIDAITAVAGQWSDRVSKVKINGKEMSLAEAKAEAIRNPKIEAKDLELACFHAHMEGTPTGQASGPFIHSVDTKIEAEALQASILRYAGTPMNATNPRTGQTYGLEKMFKPEVLEASHQRQYQFGGSIQALLDMQIRAAGKYYPGTDRRSRDFLAAAVHSWETIQASGISTLNLTSVLENVMHKASLAAFQAVEAVWPFICGRRPLTDFRPHKLYRLSMDGNFKKVAADGELKHVSMTDEDYEIQADTFGAMIAIDYPTIRNDDLGVVLDKARGIGTLGATRIEESVFVLLLSNPDNFFHTDNNNLITGSGSALSVAALSTAREKFRDQVVNGKPVSVSPRILLTGTTLETDAEDLYNEARFDLGGSNADDIRFLRNPHKGLYRPYVSPYLNNTNITDQDGAAISGQSDTQWYLFADPSSPQGAAIVIGFLDGRETPYFDQAETAFSVPRGMQFRSYLDWGVAMQVPQLGLKSAGA